MTSTTDSGSSQTAESLPLNPFVSNRYHYGMLLGVDDLQAEQGYHRGKAWLHNAWLHGGGAIWGLGVEPGQNNELVVHRGLALDHHGRELWLAADECIDIGRWFGALGNDVIGVVEISDEAELIAHVRLCADQCLDRPVPSITEPCGDSDSETTHSRTVERARLELLAGEPESATPLYPGLWALLKGTVESESETQSGADASAGSEGDCGPDGATPVPSSMRGQETGDKDAGCNDTDAGVKDPEDCQPPESDSCPDRWHRAAVEDTMKLLPADPHKPWSPFDGDGCITLARLTIRLVKSADEWRVASLKMVDNSVRPVHLSTRSLQSMIWQALCCCEDVEKVGGEYARPVASPAVALHGTPAALTDTVGGFRVDGQSVEVDGRTIVIPFTEPVDRGSVKTAGFAVATLEPDGWCEVEVKNAGPDDAGLSATLTLDQSVDASRLRIVVCGTGEQPIMSRHFEPLLGCVGDPPGASAGCDAVIVRDLSTPGTDTDRGSS